MRNPVVSSRSPGPRRRVQPRTALAAVLLLAAIVTLPLASPPVRAACSPAQPHYRYVGDTASNAQCTDDTIQSAIDNATCPDTTIVITGGHTYTAQHLNINGKSLTLTGSSQGCGPPGVCQPGDPCDPSPPTQPIITVSGAGHSGDSVLWIHGDSHVTLKYLTIRDGNNVSNDHSTYGGGIHFDGTGTLALDTVTVMSNVAGYGGGIQFTGSGGFASLTLGPRTLIIGNTANGSGGGIRLDGESYMSAFGDNSTIFNNKALNGYGGGLNVIGPAHADLASPGYGGIGIVSLNKAKYGGGIAITGGDDHGENGEVKLFTLDPLRPVRIDGNFASSSGGAAYLESYAWFFGTSLSHASLCAFDFRIDGNSAPQGSAVEATSDGPSNSYLDFNDSYDCSPLPEYAEHCAVGADCNVFSGNLAIDAGGTATDGAVVYMGEHSILFANRIRLRANRGGYALLLENHWSTVRNCLFADDEYTQQLVRSTHHLGIGNCTFADNTVGSDYLIHTEDELTFVDSIVHQPGHFVLSYTGDDVDADIRYVMAEEIDSLLAHGASHVRVMTDPGFVDAAHGDYRLAPFSLAIDNAPAIADDAYDLDGRPRDQDIPGVPNVDGPRDLGAYERSPLQCGAADTIFCDGFETW